MANSEQVSALFDRSQRSGVLLGAPPSALVIGAQHLKVEEEQEGGFVLRTTWYKYCLLFRVMDPLGMRSTEWFAMRLESDSRVGWNSWLLNHPIHHFQLGFCEELRLLSSRGRSLVAFIDAALRWFAPSAWAEMYPSLYLHLTDATGRFSSLTQVPAGADVQMRQSSASDLRDILRQARADRIDWYRDVEQWREDVDPRSECAPELFDVFAGES